jgi:predicted nuclease with TOPRIM domain
LNNELILQQFDEIELKIETLIEERESLKTANSELLYKVEDLETKLEAKLAEEARATETKRLIESKIDSLISRLGDVGEKIE